MITNQTIKSAKAKAKPGAKQQDIHDQREPILVLRIGAKGVRWQLRFTMQGQATRLDIGDVDQWTIAEAREVASAASADIRSGIRRPDKEWVFEQLVKHEKVEAPETPQNDSRHTLKWRWEDGVADFLKHVERTLKPRTLQDYTSMLRTPEMERFAGRPVASITLKEMTQAIGDVHRRGVERHAEHLASVIRPMWRHLAHLDRQDQSGIVDKKLMADLEAPARSRSPVRRKKPKYAPPLWEVGRMLVIARSGVFHPVVGAAMELLLFTAQRVTAVATAHKEDFSSIGDRSEGLWSMPPAHRKTAEKRGDEGDHIVPLPPSAWAAVNRMLDLHDDEESNPYLFRGQRPKRAGDTVASIAPSNVQHGMMYSPGIIMTPHDVRRAFVTIGAQHFNWTLDQCKSILDHNEGRESGDVTVINYLWAGTHAKWGMMRAWCGLMEQAAIEELERDPRLADLAWLKRHVVQRRDEHKLGKKVTLSLDKNPPAPLPVPDEPVDFMDAAE